MGYGLMMINALCDAAESGFAYSPRISRAEQVAGPVWRVHYNRGCVLIDVDQFQAETHAFGPANAPQYTGATFETAAC